MQDEINEETIIPDDVAPEVKADAETVEASDDADSSPADDVVVDDKEEKPNRFQERIKELTDKQRSSQRASDATAFELRQENERLQQELQSRPIPEEPLKSLEDFGFDEGQHRAYLDERTARIATNAARAEGAKLKTSHDAQRIEGDFRTREGKFQESVPDYEDTVYGEQNGARTWQASALMAEEIRFSDIGPEMGYYLAKNPEVAAEIAVLTPRETVRRMTLLESSLKSEKSKAGKKVSSAPPPPPKIKGGDAGIEKGYHEGMSASDFAKMRRKEISQR